MQPTSKQHNLTCSQVGTTFTVVFAVYNQYGQLATTTRPINIVNACDDGQTLCDGTCSEVCGACQRASAACATLCGRAEVSKCARSWHSFQPINLNVCHQTRPSIMPSATASPLVQTTCGVKEEVALQQPSPSSPAIELRSARTDRRRSLMQSETSQTPESASVELAYGFPAVRAAIFHCFRGLCACTNAPLCVAYDLLPPPTTTAAVT